MATLTRMVRQREDYARRVDHSTCLNYIDFKQHSFRKCPQRVLDKTTQNNNPKFEITCILIDNIVEESTLALTPEENPLEPEP